ncbi:mucosa-associated lymphoid tissue lymphoma translocation protein 1 [Conger conger]|uniref:mucosa-associated lymphoid tissue lymphoma translocation protein 1 n=1 Tax=Conger conger TaxID=82655 RepID=UPI002A59C9CC|nr:mucosa-associated lymphoid tissue lymphoma translocation protein 1 [Conger conger]
MISEIVIVKHPVPAAWVPKNYTLTLSVQALGTGPLSYRWFQSQDEVPGGTNADLVVKAQHSQWYVCRVNDQHCNSVFSNWVKVTVCDISKPHTKPPGRWEGEPHIAVNPTSQAVQRGDRVTLQCSAFGIPAPRFQWYRNGLPLPTKNKETLQIEKVDGDHEGCYLCSVSNTLGEKWTEPAEISIVKKLTATDKVALLIGNLNYAHHPALMAPMMDVHELANLLRQLGFRVVSLLDLTKAEMLSAIDAFLQLLDRGVYALFYYAGHGYECSGRNYLVPIDAPQPYRPENCVSVQSVMRHMQERLTALNVILLDTCRKWYNQHCALSEVRSLAPLGNTVYGYATCEDAEAFEVQDGERSSGIFTKYLNKHILRPEKITHVLEQVSEDLGRDPLVTGKQVVEIRHTLKDPRTLADPVRTTGHTTELRVRDMCWRGANELPERRTLVFPCGAEVELSFSALFSNVVIIFASVKATGRGVQDCSLSLRSNPVMEDVFSNAGCLDRIDSLLLSDTSNPDCSLRLCGLQKLQKSLVMEVDLHYTQADSKARLKESRQQDVGKPLVARCELHRRTHAAEPAGPARGERRDGGPFQSMDQKASYRQPPRHPLGRPCRPSTRKAENAWKRVSAASKNPSPRSNEPEENDENEILGCPT